MRVPSLPARWEWDHNAHYHRWLMRQLPARPGRVLDVGCGAGGWAVRLGGRAGHVDALDRSPLMIDLTRRRCAGRANVTAVLGDLLDPGLGLPVGGYDAITAVSSLHHLPAGPALDRIAELLRPGGVLVVVGHHRVATRGERMLELVRLPANAAVGAVLALRGRGEKPDPAMPVMPPSMTFAEIRSLTRLLLPGARLRRALFWRYLLVWRRPDAAVAADGPRGAGRG